MVRYFTLTCIILLTLSQNLTAQVERPPDAGGSYQQLIDIKDEINPAERANIIAMLQANEARLRNEGKLMDARNPTATAFAWPLRQASGYADNGYYGISNYVDHNPANPNVILDYNCGTRTYDQLGYNHSGTDIFTWPFSWQKMERNAVEVIAAAPGTILAKSDGNFDQNCAFCTNSCTWNAVYVRHADGSVAWYGHLKSGSLTSKAIGQSVAQNEYLGVVGSSGNSTGPHLHFEVYTNSSYTQLIDPWAGPCNNLNGQTSWWANQQSYYVPTLNKVMTHGAAPSAFGCVVSEMPNEKITFANGEAVHLASYYRDQQNGLQAVHTVYRPDSSVFSTWSQSFTAYYSASWWYYSITLPSSAPSGTWRYEVNYNNSQKQTALFVVNAGTITTCANNYYPLTSNVAGSTYQWQVNNGNGFVNINNDAVYAGATTYQLLLKQVPSAYNGYQYRCLVDGSTSSQILDLKFTSYWMGRVNNVWENPANWSCGNVPDANTDVIIQRSNNNPVVNSNAACRSLTVDRLAALTVNTGFELLVSH